MLRRNEITPEITGNLLREFNKQYFSKENAKKIQIALIFLAILSFFFFIINIGEKSFSLMFLILVGNVLFFVSTREEKTDIFRIYENGISCLVETWKADKSVLNDRKLGQRFVYYSEICEIYKIPTKKKDSMKFHRIIFKPEEAKHSCILFPPMSNDILSIIRKKMKKEE